MSVAPAPPLVPAPADLAVRSLFTDPAVAADPYPVYRVLRETAPVHRSPAGHWVLSRHADIDRVLRSARAGKSVEAFIAAQQVDDWRRHTSFTRMLDHLIWLNPPRHTRLRKLLASVLTPRAVAAYRPQIERRVAELLDPLAGGGEVDLLDELAFPLPVAVIGTLLGVPRTDWPIFRRLVRDVTLCVEPSPSVEQLAIADAAADELNAYFGALVATRRAEPRGDMISMLAAAEVDGERLAPGELNSLLQFLFGAGFETTTNLVGNGMLALLRQPDQLALLQADPGLVAGAVEELLRFDASVQLTMRTAWEDLEVGEHVVPAGASMILLLGAANRDPERYAEPDRVDVTRTAVRPISFSGGIHFCLGAALARLEGTIAFGELVRRFRAIELLDDAPPWKTSLTLHGLEALPVRLVARTPSPPRSHRKRKEDTMPTVTGLDFAALQVRDLEASAAFYTDVVGLERSDAGPPHAVVFATKPIPFAVREPSIDLDATDKLGWGVALWLHAADTDAVAERVAQAGQPILMEPFDGPFGRTFSFADPDGYAITVHDKA